ncbi:MAG: hypothetical protein QOJ63_942 [Solirubrobacteraceae bacterium]|nr:hypothetical protein [Solirubrobacteraceae bacterium]
MLSVHPRAILLRRATAPAAGIALLSGVLAPSAYGACSAAAQDGRNSVVVCRSVGHEQAFVVPDGVRSLSVVAVGAPGGSGTSGAGLSFPASGGAGGVAVADIPVTAGRTLYVLVGAIGGAREPEGGGGGFNGGGQGGASTATPNGAGGGGGGATDLRTCAIADRTCDTLASRLIVAAGGGGAGGGGAFEGASAGAGGAAGADGSGGAGTGLGAGGGATEASGGNGGPGAGTGRLGAGGSGAAATSQADAGGGGGGGRWGGGGGAARSAGESGGSGGGAGSSFGPSGTRFGRSTLAQGLVRITYVTVPSVNPPPAVRITRPRSGATVARRGALVVAGRASDASGVRGVALRIEGLPRAAGRCTWLDPVTGLGRARCDEPPSLLATLRSNGAWTYRVPARIALRSGRYRVTAYGTDETGIYGNSARASARSVRFRVRR